MAPAPRVVREEPSALVTFGGRFPSAFPLRSPGKMDPLHARPRTTTDPPASPGADEPWLHARLRRDTVHLWSLDMPGHSGRWERTPFRGQRVELVDLLFEQFSWVRANFDEAR